MKIIRTQEDYNKEFPEGVREKALHHAHEIRKFEIELYWKRATYFWTLIAAAFAGYFALIASDNAEKLTFLSLIIACIGLVLSVGWYQVNRGSKYWQSNWERHVDCLEDEKTGPLYKVTISKEKFHWYNLSGGFPVSVSKVNQVISLFVSLVWAVLIIKTIPESFLRDPCDFKSHWAILVLTLFFLGWILFFCNSKGASGEDRPVTFDECDLS